MREFLEHDQCLVKEVTDQQDSIVSTGTVSDNTTNYTNTNFTWRALTKGDNKNIILYIIYIFYQRNY